MIHCRWPSVNPSEACACGSAMFTIVVSSTTISWATPRTARIHHRRAWCGSLGRGASAAPEVMGARSRAVTAGPDVRGNEGVICDYRNTTAVNTCVSVTRLTSSLRAARLRQLGSVQQVLPVRRHLAGRAGHRLVDRVTGRRRELGSGDVLLGLVVPEPGLAGLEAAGDRMAGRAGMGCRVRGQRGIAAADVAALRAPWEVDPPPLAFTGQALRAPGAARRHRRVDPRDFLTHVARLPHRAMPMWPAAPAVPTWRSCSP